jgi:hypothetical protein
MAALFDVRTSVELRRTSLFVPNVVLPALSYDDIVTGGDLPFGRPGHPQDRQKIKLRQPLA